MEKFERTPAKKVDMIITDQIWVLKDKINDLIKTDVRWSLVSVVSRGEMYYAFMQWER